MREIQLSQVTTAIAELCIKANKNLPEDVVQKIASAKADEPWQPAKKNLKILEDNILAAQKEQLPICQDTGMACVYLKIGQEVYLSGGHLEEAVNKGVAKGYLEGYLRKSIVSDPLRRQNTKDNTPAFITTEIVPGNQLEITVMPKGIGSENMSRLAMLKPSQGRQGVVDFVVETVALAGSNPCPPIVVGVGVGGSFDKAAMIAKKALLRPLNFLHPDLFYRELEEEILEKINNLGTGPAGYGGKTTALAVLIEYAPTHIGGLPVGVNISCHATRRATVIL